MVNECDVKKRRTFEVKFFSGSGVLDIGGNLESKYEIFFRFCIRNDQV